MRTKNFILTLLLAILGSATYAQGLEGVVIERYYSSNAADGADANTQGAVVPLATGSCTYRIFINMAAGYKFSQLYGSPGHPLTISSTANFYNDPNWGVSVDPGTVTTTNIRKNTGMIDSWFTMGGTASGKVGVPKIEDTDGSLGNAQSILANNAGSCFGLPINGSGSQDGMVNAGVNTYVEPSLLGLGSALDVIDQSAGNSIVINDGAIAALGGVVGPTSSNMVLVGQFTTSGSLSIQLNLQLINIATGLPENYVASSPGSGELTSSALTQTLTPTCPSTGNTDSPDGASLVQVSPNAYYPNCYPISGTTVGYTNSSESSGSSGPDRWYRFVAQSSGVSITVTSPEQDDVIELYEKIGSNYVLVSGGLENASSGPGDFERLNLNNLTPGTTYYVSVAAASGSSGSPFTICIQHLMPSGCAYSQPAGGFNLCQNYKAIYRGAFPTVSYAFSFTGVGGGASGTTAVSGTNGFASLSNPALALRYGGIYDVAVNVTYNLTNSASVAEPITINGASTGFCDNVTIMNQPLVEAVSTQRCPATLVRSAWLRAVPVSSGLNTCGVTNYTYEFTPVISCADGTTTGLATTYSTIGSSPYLQLGVLPNLPNIGAWDVKIRPNFAYGSGTYGPTQRIQVSGTAASFMLDESAVGEEAERTIDVVETSDVSIYPNPSNGSVLNVNMVNCENDMVEVRLMDATGREILRTTYQVEGSLNKVISFENQLASGLYMFEIIDGMNVISKKFVVKN